HRTLLSEGVAGLQDDVALPHGGARLRQMWPVRVEPPGLVPVVFAAGDADLGGKNADRQNDGGKAELHEFGAHEIDESRDGPSVHLLALPQIEGAHNCASHVRSITSRRAE